MVAAILINIFFLIKLEDSVDEKQSFFQNDPKLLKLSTPATNASAYQKLCTLGNQDPEQERWF